MFKLMEIGKNSKNLNKIEEIYLYSIPESERIDFEDLKNCKFPNSKILGFYNDDLLIGFSFISIFEEFVYIVYLAIDKDQRNKGYGSKALKKLFNLYPNKTKVLCVEKPDSETDIKTKRIFFYKRNGFKLANLEFDFLGEKYYTMHKGVFLEKKFKELLSICFPDCENFKKIEG